MRHNDQSQTNTKKLVRDAAIQITRNHNAINTAAVVLRGMAPTHNALIELLTPVVFSALFLAFFF